MHDLGKAHPAFQKRLCRACPAARSCPEVCIKSSPEQVYIGHAAPSASLAMAYTRDVILSEAIRRHHTALQDLTEVKAYWVNGDYADRVKELEAIYSWPRAAALNYGIRCRVAGWIIFLVRKIGIILFRCTEMDFRRMTSGYDSTMDRAA